MTACDIVGLVIEALMVGMLVTTFVFLLLMAARE